MLYLEKFILILKQKYKNQIVDMLISDPIFIYRAAPEPLKRKTKICFDSNLQIPYEKYTSDQIKAVFSCVETMIYFYICCGCQPVQQALRRFL